MTDTATLEARLAEAETAYHQLLTGARAASVEYAGRKTSFSKADIAELRAYIAELKRQLGRGPRRRAIGTRIV